MFCWTSDIDRETDDCVAWARDITVLSRPIDIGEFLAVRAVATLDKGPRS